MIEVQNVVKIYAEGRSNVSHDGSENLVQLQDNNPSGISAAAPCVEALRDVSLTIVPSPLVCLVGPSGCGKSTLLNLIGGIDRPTRGTIRVNGEDITRYDDARLTVYRRKQIGFVFQFFNLLPTMTAAENIALPAQLAGTRAEREILKKVDELLRAVDMEPRRRHFPHQLSGGEMQRVAIARALINEPDYILADEPTGNLDSVAGDQVLELLTDLGRKGRRTILVATHSEAIARKADCVIRMRDGRIEGGAT